MLLKAKKIYNRVGPEPFISAAGAHHEPELSPWVNDMEAHPLPVSTATSKAVQSRYGSKYPKSKLRSNPYTASITSTSCGGTDFLTGFIIGSI